MKSCLLKRLLISLCMLAMLGSLAGAAAETPDGLFITPEGYTQGGPLPIYRALERNQKQANFFDKVDLGWFNSSGQASYENQSKRGRYDHVVYNDEAQLSIDINYIDYTEYDGTEMWIYGEDPDSPAGPFARESFASAIGSLGGSARFYQIYPEPKDAPRVELKKTELSGITLEEARAQVDALLEKLGVTGYAPVHTLDMSVEHIHTLGAYEAKRWAESYNKSDSPWDFSQATEADEGFYLYYEKTLDGLKVGSPEGVAFYAYAFVNASGVVSFRLCDSYAVGEIYDTPEKLLTADEIRTKFEKDNARREKDGIGRPTFTGAQLMYMPMRAARKKDGMVFAPVWYIQYDWLDVTQPCDGWAWYSAVDGRLVEDCYS